MSEQVWMIDAAMSYEAADGLFTFCPVERDEDGEITSIVTGMMFMGSEPPRGERCIGIFHEDGQEACDAFNEAYAEQIKAVFTPTALLNGGSNERA